LPSAKNIPLRGRKTTRRSLHTGRHALPEADKKALCPADSAYIVLQAMTLQARVISLMQEGRRQLWLAKRPWALSEDSSALVCAHCSRALQHFLRALVLAHRRKLPAEMLDEELVEEACEELPELFPMRQELLAILRRPETLPWDGEDPLPAEAHAAVLLVEEVARRVGKSLFSAATPAPAGSS
jgi:hypothetical protein